VFFLVNGFLLCLQVFRFKQQPDRRQRLMAVSALIVTAMTACLPHAHELRYWLFLPLILIPVNLRFLLDQDKKANFVPYFLGAMTLLSISLAALSPKSDLQGTRLVTEANRQLEIPPAVMRALAIDGRYCDPSDDGLFRYSVAATGVKGILSRNADDCKVR
jgi:hypothetical protein